MRYALPNRIGQMGLYHAGEPPALTLSGAALARHRRCVEAPDLMVGDFVGVAIDGARGWAVALGVWDGAALRLAWVKDAGGVLLDGEAVEVRVVASRGITLRLMGYREAVPGMAFGAGPGTLWVPESQWWEHDGTTATSITLTLGDWGALFDPIHLGLQCDLWVPDGAVAGGFAALTVATDPAGYLTDNPHDPPADGAWLPFECYGDGGSGPLLSLTLGGLSAVPGWRLRDLCLSAYY